MCPTGFTHTVEGSWENWANWASCTVTCGPGTRTRSRVHSAAVATADQQLGRLGEPCTGSTTHAEDCQSEVYRFDLISISYQCKAFLLVEGSWSSWEQWGSCSTSCGQGAMTRSRGHSAGTPCSGSPAETGTCQG